MKIKIVSLAGCLLAISTLSAMNSPTDTTVTDKERRNYFAGLALTRSYSAYVPEIAVNECILSSPYVADAEPLRGEDWIREKAQKKSKRTSQKKYTPMNIGNK